MLSESIRFFLPHNSTLTGLASGGVLSPIVEFLFNVAAFKPIRRLCQYIFRSLSAVVSLSPILFLVSLQLLLDEEKKKSLFGVLTAGMPVSLWPFFGCLTEI